MGIRTYKPTSPGTRNRSVIIFSGTVKRNKPEKTLTQGKLNRAGRNNRGVITCRHRGGGHKQLYRKIDFKRNKIGMFARVASIEYDPNRNAHIALINYIDGEKRYILSPEGLKKGEKVISDYKAPLAVGNALPLISIPLGTEIHNIELFPGQGGQLVRAAGTQAQLIGKNDRFASLRLPSGEVRYVLKECWATIGQVGNEDKAKVLIGKAGRHRWLNKRPTVRGSVMNPVDHPHGGGEGKAPIGRARPVTPWGKPALCQRTRQKNLKSSKYILTRRNKK